MAKPKPHDPAALKRESAGRYASIDGRFVVEQASGGWMVMDAEQRNELGLPLVRGPFGTLARAKAAVLAAREDPAPESRLAARIAAVPARRVSAATTPPVAAGQPQGPTAPPSEPIPTSTPERVSAREPDPEPISGPEPPVIREWQLGDGDQLRRLWEGAGMLSPWDDDASLASMARRNPGLLLVAASGDVIVGSALGGWDGRRGWIYHVAIAPDHRRQGIGRQLVERIEEGLRELGCPKVNVMVLDENIDGAAFWAELGYTMLPARQFGRRLAEREGSRPG